jgi:hypothetical protein
MTELQNCLPEHARLFFIRLRNLKWDEARQSYQGRLSASRQNAAAGGSINSGFQKKAEWDLAIEHIGNLAWGYFQAGIEACTLYDIPLTAQLCQCIEVAVKEFLVVQQKNALTNAAKGVPGAPPIPPASSVQQLHSGPLPRYSEILITLEKARVESEKAVVQRMASTAISSQAVNRAIEQRRGNRADVLNVLIASPSDVNQEKDAVIAAIHDWNATNSHPDTLNILLQPIRWETHSFPESGDRPQALLNRQIVTRGDFLIGIFGTRLGTPTGVADSGTIEEIEEFRKAGKYVALYFSNAPVPRDVDRKQLEALELYKKARQADTKYEVFSDPDDLRRQVLQHLTGIVMSVAKPLQLGMWRIEEPSAIVSGSGAQNVEAVVREEIRRAEEARRRVEEERAEAARWKPSATIVSTVDGGEQINKMNLKSQSEFALIRASLLSPEGVNLHDYPVLGEKTSSTGFSVPISHESLLKIANKSQSYFQFGTFQGSLKYTVIRKRDEVESTGLLPFQAETAMLNNRLWFKLTG